MVHTEKYRCHIDQQIWSVRSIWVAYNLTRKNCSGHCFRNVWTRTGITLFCCWWREILKTIPLNTIHYLPLYNTHQLVKDGKRNTMRCHSKKKWNNPVPSVLDSISLASLVSWQGWLKSASIVNHQSPIIHHPSSIIHHHHHHHHHHPCSSICRFELTILSFPQEVQWIFPPTPA